MGSSQIGVAYQVSFKGIRVSNQNDRQWRMNLAKALADIQLAGFGGRTVVA